VQLAGGVFEDESTRVRFDIMQVGLEQEPEADRQEQAAAEAQAEAEDETNTDQTAEETPASVEAGKTSKVVVGLAGIGLMFLVFGGIGLFFVFRNLRSMEDEDEEEVEENEEEVGVGKDKNA